MADTEDSITSQIYEIELLSSIYTGEEFVVKPELLALLYQVKEGKSDLIPDVYYEIKVAFDSVKCEIVVDIPLSYPLDKKPEIYVRSQSFTREIQKELNDDLADYLSSLEQGAVCVYDAVMWIQDQVRALVKNDAKSNCKGKSKYRRKKVELQTFTRLWIYSHHIYCKNKRREIVSTAINRNLTGFSLFGKPGIICVEGPQTDVTNWWAAIRALEWHKIESRRKDEAQIPSEAQGEAFLEMRCFSDFKEIAFEKRGSTHNDMGEFKTFLKTHNCDDVFKDLFKL